MILADISLESASTVTPSDTDNLTMPSGTNRTKGVYVGVTGNLAVMMSDNTEVTFTSIAAGVVHNLSIKRVLSTGTTATSIIALY